MKSRATGCVYCGREGPYTDEHVVPAGLGAGDGLRLVGLVCAQCNSDFSKLEAAVLRRGDIGFARKALQPLGRARGRKSRPPTFEASTSILHDGHSFEARVFHRLASEVLPQIAQRDDWLHATGREPAKVREFVERLRALLRGQLVLIHKEGSGPHPFTRYELTFGQKGYVTGPGRGIAKPEKNAIWIEPRRATPDSPERCIVQRTAAGSVAVQVEAAGIAQAAEFLTLLKANLACLDDALAAEASVVEIPRPNLHVSMESAREEEAARFFAKVGFNLLVHIHGHALCRDSSFDDICAFVRSGSPELRMGVWQEEQVIAPLMNKRFKQQHWFLLTTFATPAGTVGAQLTCSLYGGGNIRSLALASNMPTAMADVEAVFAVDYVLQRVERFNFLELVASMMADVQQARGTNLAS